MRLETPVLPTALCKSSRILQSRILGEFAGVLWRDLKEAFHGKILCVYPHKLEQ